MSDLFFQFALTFDSTLRIATPIVIAALAGLFSERSGVVDIGLEGKMLGAAFAAAATSALFIDPQFLKNLVCLFETEERFNEAVTIIPALAKDFRAVVDPNKAALIPEYNNISFLYYSFKNMAPIMGLFAGIIFSVGVALIHGFACITHKGDQIISGMALNILVAGLAPTLAHAWFHHSGRTPLLNSSGRFSPIELPFVETIGEIPVIGTIYVEIISGHNIFVYLALILVPLIAWLLYNTRFGLRLRAVGESPNAVDTAGISVTALRYRAVMICGALCGFAGSSLSIAQGSQFLRDMTAGKGYLALAALIFGKWKPVPTLIACLIFAFADATQARLQGVSLPIIGKVPSQAIEALPYVLTVFLLAGFVGKAIPPKAIGRPYVKEK